MTLRAERTSYGPELRNTPDDLRMRESVEAKTTDIRDATRNRTADVVRTMPAAARAGADITSAGASSPEDEAAKAAETKRLKEAAEAEQARQLAAQEEQARQLAAATTAAEKPTEATAEGMPWKTIRNKALPITLASGAAIAAGTGAVGSWPILNKIPYLPQIASSITSGAGSVANFLGINTGPAATYSLLASLPAWVGPALGGAIVAPPLLSAAGWLKGVVLGKEYGGFWNCAKEGARLPLELVNLPFGAVNTIRKNAWGWTQKGFDKTVGAGYRQTKRILKSPITHWGTAGAVAGVTFASFAGAPVLIPSAIAGFAAANMIRWASKFMGMKGGQATTTH